MSQLKSGVRLFTEIIKYWFSVFLVIFFFQPNPSNKLAIIHILGLLSNLFTTLDISKQDDESADTSAPPVKTTAPPPGPNPVSYHAPSAPLTMTERLNPKQFLAKINILCAPCKSFIIKWTMVWQLCCSAAIWVLFLSPHPLLPPLNTWPIAGRSRESGL